MSSGMATEISLIGLQVATLVHADWLFLLTDVPCLYTANPLKDPSAKPIHEVHDIAALQVCSTPFTSCTCLSGQATSLPSVRCLTFRGENTP